MGALDYLSNFCTVTSTRGKRKPMQVLISHTNTYHCVSKLFAFFFLVSDLNFLFLDFLMQTVEIRVKLDCDGCERRVKNAVKNMKGDI